MLIHITPTFHDPLSKIFSIESVYLKEFGFAVPKENLIGRYPWPNKQMKVGCRKIGKKAMLGLLFNVPVDIEKVTVVSRWVSGGFEVEKTVEYIFNNFEDDQSIATDHPLAWPNGAFYPSWAQDMSPAQMRRKASAQIDGEDEVLGYEILSARSDDLYQEMIMGGRIPSIKDAFEIPFNS